MRLSENSQRNVTEFEAPLHIFQIKFQKVQSVSCVVPEMMKKLEVSMQRSHLKTHIIVEEKDGLKIFNDIFHLIRIMCLMLLAPFANTHT